VTNDLDHDATGRITTVKKGGATQTTFTYNAKGQLQSVASPAGTTSYTYVTGAVAERGMLATVDDPVFSSGVSTYAYDAAGRIATRTDSQSGAGIVWTRTYEPQTSRVGTQTIYKGAAKLGEFILTYDEAGNVATRTERVGTNTSDPRNGQTSYSYDAAGGSPPPPVLTPPTLRGPPGPGASRTTERATAPPRPRAG
jgi:YD repeat-containing protein